MAATITSRMAIAARTQTATRTVVLRLRSDVLVELSETMADQESTDEHIPSASVRTLAWSLKQGRIQ